MGKKTRSFSRFYAVCRAMGIDTGDYKDDLVSEFTGGRTVHLRDMTDREYDDMCDCLQNGGHPGQSREEFLERRRRSRSAVLKRLQKLGVDTTDFARVNAFCQSKRIAGKPFGSLTIAELDALVPKLEAMLRKGGVSPVADAAAAAASAPAKPKAVKYPMPIYLNMSSNRLPS